MANSPSRTLILAEAARRGWQTQEVGDPAYFLKIMHPDGRWEMVRGTEPMRTSAIGQTVTKFKHLTLDFIKTYGYKVPAYALVTDEQHALEFLAAHGCIVLKPVDGQRSEGVTVDIRTQQQVAPALKHAINYSRSGRAIVQEQIEGNLYRLLILDGKMVAATWRTGLTVTGDGVHTVTELINEQNLDPRRGERADLAMKVIDLPTASVFVGSEVMASIPTSGKIISISSMDSVPGGGAIGITDVHQDWQNFAVHLSRELGLFISGFDFICEDISKPMPSGNVPILEINAAPGLRIHRYPTGGGEAIDIAPLLLDALFPVID